MSQPSVASIIRRTRINNNLTQGELARRMGLHRKVLSALELDRRTPSGEEARLLKKILGIDCFLSERSVPTTYGRALIEMGRVIRTARVNKDLTQPELAALIGVTESVIQHLEIGHHPPRDTLVEKLERVLEIQLPLTQEPDIREDTHRGSGLRRGPYCPKRSRQSKGVKALPSASGNDLPSSFIYREKVTGDQDLLPLLRAIIKAKPKTLLPVDFEFLVKTNQELCAPLTTRLIRDLLARRK